MGHKVKIACGRATRNLAERIASAYHQELVKTEVCEYSDGDFQPAFCENIRGCNIFLIQSTFPPADNLMELLYMIDGAKRASANKIIAIIPYFGTARQDRKDKPRIPIGAKLVANLLTSAGVDRVITMDLHADQIQGFFDIPVDNIYSSRIFLPYLKKRNFKNLCIASPDTGGTKRAAAYAKYLNTDLAIGFKQRPKPNEIASLRIIGDVKDKDVVIVDDIVDTAGTLLKAAREIKEEGAKSVRAMCVHPVLSGKAYENIENSCIEELIVTDTIPLKRKSDKITVISTAKLFAAVIEGCVNNSSISSLFDYDHFKNIDADDLLIVPDK